MSERLDRAVKLACSMFAGHTGMSREQILHFFATRGMDTREVPDVHPARRNALRHCLGRLNEREQLVTLRALLNHSGAMRHGRPKVHDRERLSALLESN